MSVAHHYNSADIVRQKEGLIEKVQSALKEFSHEYFNFGLDNKCWNETSPYYTNFIDGVLNSIQRTALEKSGHRGRSTAEQFREQLNKWGITIDDVLYVKPLPSFHDVSQTLYQRTDTGHFFIVTRELSYDDLKDDYFSWRYVNDDEIAALGCNDTPGRPAAGLI